MTTAHERPRLRWGLRFSPHVIPFLATIGLAWIPFQSAIVSGVLIGRSIGPGDPGRHTGVQCHRRAVKNVVD